jgi:pilus assembly protein CpaB
MSGARDDGPQYGAQAAQPAPAPAPALNRRLLLISVALGALGALLLALYLHRFELEVSGGERIALLTPLRRIERGQLISADMLGVLEVPVAYVEPRAVRAAQRSKVVGIKAAHPLDPQVTVLWTDLAIAVEDRDLSSLVQPGSRAVTVEASQGIGRGGAASGLIRPGDYVDVIATLRPEERSGGDVASIVLLQRVLVLAVGSETQPQAFSAAAQKGGRAPAQKSALTLSLKLEEAQLLSLARERGSLSVALRSPDDEKVVDGLPDMPISGLFDAVLRADVQRARTGGGVRGAAPVRMTAGGKR